MSELSIPAMNLRPELARAVELMGFEQFTPIQAQAIPVLRSGADLVARSQTGTGKTVAFGIPAIEAVDQDAKAGIQVLILCPTRELAMQAAEELRKLARFMPAIQPVEIYGGAPIDRQCIRLRRANIVVGTPGRVMDHMRRKSIKLANLKMLILDEADEMLNMGFKEDIETILQDTPAEGQTVLFSATMPPAIMAITKEYQNDPQLIEIDKAHATLDNISQCYIDVPHSSKLNALDLLLQFYRPRCAIVFCNTKSMVDEVTAHLNEQGLKAEALHGDLKQSQRTTVMHGFKTSRTAILVATDIAARGIDVNNVEYVINYDIPQNTEYYIHRIGRTGRAGKSGMSITVCGNKREVMIMRSIARTVKSDINQMEVPTVSAIKAQSGRAGLARVEAILQDGPAHDFRQMVQDLVDSGYPAQAVAAAALQAQAEQNGHTQELTDLPPIPQKRGRGDWNGTRREGDYSRREPREGDSRGAFPGRKDSGSRNSQGGRGGRPPFGGRGGKSGGYDGFKKSRGTRG